MIKSSEKGSLDGVAVPKREVLSSNFARLMEFRDRENLEILRIINVQIFTAAIPVRSENCLSTEPASIKAEND